MADLDDFFAKKDRKKKSSSKKYATTEEVAKKLEDSAKKPEKGAAKKERPAQEGEDVGAPVHEQDEWRDFEEEKKDYSGLKIGNLTINPSTDGNSSGTETGVEQQPCYDDSGNEVEKKSGPWKRLDQEPPAEHHVPQPQQQPERKPASSTGAYISPNLRGMHSQPQQIQPSRLRLRAAPDIHNEEFFPTLSGSTKSEQKRNRGEGAFEVVAQHKSSSHRYSEQSKVSSTQGPKLNLSNQYNTLSNDS